MAFEIDHLFIWTSLGGAEASRLAAFGLTEGPPNTHPGQRTACRRFFFANCYIELLWVCNAEEAKSETTRPAHFCERWQGRTTGACPFGLALRHADQREGGVPFSSWEYHPAYLPGSLTIHVGANAGVLTEPSLFYLPFAQRSDRYPIAKRPPLQHPAGMREVTSITLNGPFADGLSPAMAAVLATGLVQLRRGPEYLVRLGFDGESRSQQADFRPLLPLAFSW